MAVTDTEAAEAARKKRINDFLMVYRKPPADDTADAVMTSLTPIASLTHALRAIFEKDGLLHVAFDTNKQEETAIRLAKMTGKSVRWVERLPLQYNETKRCSIVRTLTIAED